MGAGGEPENQDASARISEAGNRASPVLLVLVSATASLPDTDTVGTQAWAALAGDDGFADRVVAALVDGEQ
jgi:hypothetical protein